MSLTSRLKSVDLDRIDVEKTSSPSEFDKMVPLPTPSFKNELIAQVGENEKEELVLFQSYAIGLLKNAIESDDPDFVKNTTNSLHLLAP